MPEHNPGQMGGTMRLGKRRTIFKTENSILSKCISLTEYYTSNATDNLFKHISLSQENCMEMLIMSRKDTDIALRCIISSFFIYIHLYECMYII